MGKKLPIERLDSQGRRLPKVACPHCDHPLDAATRVGDNFRPKPGDITICLKCSEILVFQPDMTVRLAFLNDLLNLPKEEARLLEKGQALIRRKRPLG